MTVEPANLLIIMADEHTRRVVGCYDNPHVQTPNIDRLAARGTMFTEAYSPSPICIPGRAICATGRPVHQTGNWDNAAPYAGVPESWGHVLQDAKHPVESFGKLHFRRVEDPVGFDRQTLPMHVVDGIGDVLGAVRNPLPKRRKTRAMAEKIGPGETSYTRYDRDVCAAAVHRIEELAERPANADKPWTLFASFVAPHFPLIAPQQFYELYRDLGLMPRRPRPDAGGDHPWIRALRGCFVYDNFTEESTRIALASYYGLVSFVDHHVGKLLDALERTGLDQTTRVLYVSDHGDNVGERGLWGKSNFYEEAAGIPTVLAGPGVASGRLCQTPVSLYDVFPTVLHGAGLGDGEASDGRPGRSLISIADAKDDGERSVFGEYHAAGAASAAYMIRRGRFKYIHYVGYQPQLFDLADDPCERHDLAADPAQMDRLREFETELRRHVDPEAVDRMAKADQAACVARNGGREVVIAQGGFGATPPPGETPRYA